MFNDLGPIVSFFVENGTAENLLGLYEDGSPVNYDTDKFF
jgi:hypothetical protein